MKNSSAVEVLKEMRSLFNESNSWEVTQERDNALYQALLALEQKEKLLKLCNELEEANQNELEKTLFGKLIGTAKVKEVLGEL